MGTSSLEQQKVNSNIINEIVKLKLLPQTMGTKKQIQKLQQQLNNK
jgi:hypothetical protein|tara:strand:- start:372 stop:509 length:138 start_codon:yes stop_codon:yes gene_type:complete